MKVWLKSAVVCLACVPALALAQVPTPQGGVPQAPVGHRQPRPADLPTDDQSQGGVAKKGARTSTRNDDAADALERRQEKKFNLGVPKICTNC